jgi:hypothetical protein
MNNYYLSIHTPSLLLLDNGRDEIKCIADLNAKANAGLHKLIVLCGKNKKTGEPIINTILTDYSCALQLKHVDL